MSEVSVSIEKIVDSELEVDVKSECENENENESNSISEFESDTTPFYDHLEESHLDDLISNINELMEEYLNSEILKMSKPDFHKEMVEDITHVVFQNLLDADICKDSDYDSLFEMVDIQCQTRDNPNFPLRSIKHCNYNYHCGEYGLDEEFVLSYLQNKIDHLRKVNQEAPKQRTPEWYQRRYNMMTASNLWQALSTESQRNRLIYEKCKPLDFGYTENKWVNTDNSLHWGVKYEPLTALVYEKMTGAKIEEFGCIQHEKYPFLGASPDGIVTNSDSPLFGRMLEIKNIYNREMDGTPSEPYWIQIQMQLECCNLDVCDFVETRFKEYGSEIEFFEEPDNNLLRGLILHFVPKDGKSNVPLYKYMPLDISLNDREMNEWITSCKNELPEYAVYVKIYWYLDDIQMSTIQRHSIWFEESLPILKQTWVTIEEERVTGYEHRAAKKRIVNDVIVVNSMDGSESHIIKNMPSTNGAICLIKIDSDDK
jgi:putative phage-type endonuclease